MSESVATVSQLSTCTKTEFWLQPPGSGENCIWAKTYVCTDPVGTVLLVHGLGGHGNGFGRDVPLPFLRSLLEYFLDARFSVMIYDQRCFGRSTFPKAYISDYDELLNDLRLVINCPQCVDLRQNGKFLLFGHSMGGQLVAHYLMTGESDAVDGAIISSPWFQLVFQPPAWKLFIGKMLGFCFPHMKLPSDAKYADWCDREPGELEQLYNDGLGTPFLTASLFFNCVNAAKYTLEHGADITTPVLFVHGKQDKVTSWEATQRVFEECSSTEKQARFFEQMPHDTYNSRTNMELCEFVVEWCTAATTHSRSKDRNSEIGADHFQQADPRGPSGSSSDSAAAGDVELHEIGPSQA